MCMSSLCRGPSKHSQNYFHFSTWAAIPFKFTALSKQAQSHLSIENNVPIHRSHFEEGLGEEIQT